MEMNATNVAQRQIFRRKPGFVDEKMHEKSSFGELSTDEIQEIVDNAVPVRTKKAAKFGTRLFNGIDQLSFPKKLQNFKYDRPDFTHS